MFPTPPTTTLCFCVTLLALLAACGHPASEQCAELAAARDDSAAADRCSDAFGATGDPAAALAAGKALLRLGRNTEALAWADTLEGTPLRADGLGLAARVHDRLGDPEAAQRARLGELELRRRDGDPAGASRVLYTLFFKAWRSSEHRLALDRAAEALTAAERAEDPDLQARALYGLYTVLYEIGDLDGAGRALDRAVALQPPEDPGDEARWRVNRGLLQLDRGRLALAQRDFERGLELTTPSGHPRLARTLHANLLEARLRRDDLGTSPEMDGHLEALHRLGADAPTTGRYYAARVALARGLAAEAIQHLERALADEKSPDWRWELELRLGQAQGAAGDADGARRAYGRSADLLDAMRDDLGLDDLKASFLDRKRRPLEALFRLEVRAGRISAALSAMERAKARTLLDAWVRSSSRGLGDGDATWSTAGDRAEELADLLPSMLPSSSAPLLPTQELIRRVRRHHVLAYFRAEDELFRTTLQQGQVQIRALGSMAEVEALVDRLDTEGLGGEGPDAAASALAAILLPDAAELPRRGTTLALITDGALGRVPFAALPLGNGYLVERHDLVHVPSLHALATAPQVRDHYDGTAHPPVVLGDPGGDLPAAAAEARDVADLLGVEPAIGAGADRAALRRGSRAPLLHVAAHTGLGATGPWLGLADGNLSTADLLAVPMAPRVAVLAGCVSGRRRGDGAWGSLGASFLAAGAGSAVVTLASVDDGAARRLVHRLYREGGATDPIRGLANAQRASIAEGLPPSDWAPFLVLGRPAAEGSRPNLEDPP
ncbi:MAG: CHAT domain-containing tetratricopeptide repeat protein [Acidobacteriota bacterium]